MHLHGALAEIEPPGDLLVGAPLGDEAQHVALALRQGRERAARRGETLDGAAPDYEFAAADRRDRLRDLRRGQRLADEGVRALGPDGPEQAPLLDTSLAVD